MLRIYNYINLNNKCILKNNERFIDSALRNSLDLDNQRDKIHILLTFSEFNSFNFLQY